MMLGERLTNNHQWIPLMVVASRTSDEHQALMKCQSWISCQGARHLMDWGQSFGALALGGSGSSQCRGLVMTLLAVDTTLLYFAMHTYDTPLRGPGMIVSMILKGV